jgi:gamma-glutamylputrescine oxidase
VKRAAARAIWAYRLFEQSAVPCASTTALKCKVHTARGSVRAKSLVLGCNAYLNGLNPHLSGKVLPAGSYIIATEPLEPKRRPHALLPQNMAVCDQRVARWTTSVLSADRRLLFGGACHYSGRDPTGHRRPTCGRRCWRCSRNLAEDVRIDYQWGGMIGIGANRLPQIGRLA